MPPRRPLSRACARLLTPRRSAIRLLAERRSALAAASAPALALALTACSAGGGASDPPPNSGAVGSGPAVAGDPGGGGPATVEDRDHTPTPADEKAAAAEARAGNGFAEDLYGKVRGAEGNLFLSPLSVRIALAMTHAGARGETASEMAGVLRFESEGDALHGAMFTLQRSLTAAVTGEQALAIANRLWGARGEAFLGPFLQLTRTYYGAALETLDFAGDTEGARQTINAWVSERTKEKIPELLAKGAVDANTALVLTNAIYFKGLWARPFDPKLTQDAPFKVGDKTVQAPMMSQRGKFMVGEIAGATVLELPYVGDRLRMTLVIPKAVDGLAAVEAALADKPEVAFTEWVSGCSERDVQVVIPRFTVDSSFSLGDALQAMGMRKAFGAADFSGMNGEKGGLRISAVIHRAFVQVSEEGTEAAAATGVVMTRSMPPRIVADRPFLFAIRDAESGAILFLGRLVNPGA